MEVLDLLDRLENLISSGRRFPLTSKVMVDEERVFEILDEIRSGLPEEIRQARWMTRERERFLEEARQEAENIVKQAKEYVAKMADETSIAQQAQAQAEEVIEQARKVAREIRQGAREYADEILTQLENTLGKALEAVRRGREELRAGKSG